MTPRRSRSEGTTAANVRARHIPVLLSEVVEALRPRDAETFIDATFGAGGYTRALLEAADIRVIAIDRDPTAIAGGAQLAGEFPGRLTLVEGRFGALDEIAAQSGAPHVDGVVLDVGVSSMQLECAERGFSFRADGPLDMRMSGTGPSAADVVNTADEATLAAILRELGEEHRARAMARAIVKVRGEKPITRTRELANIVARVTRGASAKGRDPATRTFQALRIYVNDELGELARGLAAAERALKPEGRLAVVTFHSLEDRIVKRFLALRAGRIARGSRHLPDIGGGGPSPSFRIVNPRPLTPSKGEIAANPRARSARLRAAVRTEAAAWPFDLGELGMPAVAL